MNPSLVNNNIGFACSDYQVEKGLGEKTALIFIDTFKQKHEYTFNDLRKLSNRSANLLINNGVQFGDRVMILLPRIPELFIFFLGALKSGANGSILFTSIGEDVLKDRLVDADAKFIITNIRLLYKSEKIFADLKTTVKVLVIDDGEVNGSFIGIKDQFIRTSDKFITPLTLSDQPSHLHFTSGSTGKPKGVQHVHGALKNMMESFKEVIQPDIGDVYWCTADQGWVTGVTYGIIGPWVNGITQIQVEGNYNPELWMNILEEYNVNILYSAPTVFRMLMQLPDEFFKQFNLHKLKRIYCVGEPLNPPIIQWGKRVIGKEIYDTWFQTETGSIMIGNRPGIEIRPGSMGKPLSYIHAEILGEDLSQCPVGKIGLLCLERPWHSMFSEYLNNPQTYKEKFLGNYYSSGDMAYKDQDGYFWFIGRNDDIINTAGHLVSPFEIESSLLELPEVLDIGVVGVPDEILFEKIVAYVVTDITCSNIKKLEIKLKLHISQKLSSIAAPKEIVFVESIPKTKSGKIMRRVLRKKYLNEDLGDLSTIEEF
jgi:acetyl-CoA synthetase